jgi:hypothetical protein
VQWSAPKKQSGPNASRPGASGPNMRRGTADGGRPLVSAETASDFQLQPGDLIRLRLQSASDHQYHVAPFHCLGIGREPSPKAACDVAEWSKGFFNSLLVLGGA